MKLTLALHIEKSREAVAANKAKGNRHAELLATMYAQPSRFIEEILQNTEDAYSRKKSDEPVKTIRFKLFENRIEIHHNGKDFDEADLMSITTFANTTKKNNNEINLIGKFGIGFKSVFSVTDLPEIHCGPYHYAIADYEVLVDTGKKNSDNGFNTLIILPFKKKQENELHEAVYKGLTEINDYYLLFLKQLNCIEFYNGNALLTKLERSRTIKNTRLHLVNINKTFYRETSTSVDANFFVFSGNHSSKKQQAELAFKYTETEGKYHIQPVHNAPLFAYFPTRMHSGLNVIINAPFTTNPLREYIPFDTDQAPENLKNLDEAVLLLCQALDVFKQMKLLDLTLISLLPLKKSESNEIKKADDSLVYQNFYEAVLNYFKTKEAIPVGGNRFAAVDEVLIPHNDELATLLDTKDLQKLYQKKHFVNPEICNQSFNEVRTYFSEMMQISTADPGSFGFRMLLNAGILKEKKTYWLKQFYKYIHKNENLWSLQHVSDYYSLRNAPIILTRDHGFQPAFDAENNPKVFIPNEKKSFLPVIHKKILDDPECHTFFQDLGIKIPDVADDVEYNIIPCFKKHEVIYGSGYFKKLSKIIEAYLSVSHERKEKIVEILKQTPFLWCKSSESTGKFDFKKPCDAYFFTPELVNYFENYRTAFILEADFYKKCIRKFQEQFILLLEETGVERFPRITVSSDEKEQMEGFDFFAVNITIKRSQSLIRMLLKVNKEKFYHHDQPYLRECNWIYSHENLFRSPNKLLVSDISTEYRLSEKEKYSLYELLGITANKESKTESRLAWLPTVTPDEAAKTEKPAIATIIDAGSFTISLSQIHQILSASGKSNPEERPIYSEEDIEKMSLWSIAYVESLIKKENEKGKLCVKSSELADLEVIEEGGVEKFIFVCGKTDLMNYYPLTALQLIRICNLFLQGKLTFLFFISSAGAKDAAFKIVKTPFYLLADKKFIINGRIWLSELT